MNQPVIKKLTQISVEKMKPDPRKRVEYPDRDCPGLYLVVQPTGRKSWAVRYRLHGHPRKLTLDGFPALKNARTLARTALNEVAYGRDPTAEKRAARKAEADAKAGTFKVVARNFIERHARTKTPRSANQTEGRLKPAVARWADRPISDIRKRDVISLLDDIVDRGAPIMANNVFAVVRKLFNWAVAKDIVAANPCAGVEAPSKIESRERVLTDEELKLFWQACGALGYPFGHIGKLLLLTGQRLREVAGMSADEIDLVGRQWVIPKERAKNNKTHIVPLSNAALAAIDEVEARPRAYSPKGLLFTTTGETAVSGFSKAKRAFDKAMGDLPPWRLHDVRRSVATGLQKLHIDLPITEAILNHSSGSRAGIVGIYQRHDYAGEKRVALEAWGAHVTALVEGQSRGRVLPMRGKAR